MIDVKKFGAVGDGVTLDDDAINAAYAEAKRLMGTPGGSGCVYFPPSSDFYRVSTLKTPSMDYGHGWLVSLFENGLLVDTVIPGNNNRFVGFSSNFRGLGGSFVRHSFAEWQQPKNAVAPLLNIQGGDQIEFEGIGLASQTSGIPTVKIENDPNGNGTVYVTFMGCTVIGQESPTQPSFLAHGAFGLEMSRCSLGNLYLAMGQVTIEKSFLHSIYYQNPGSPSAGDLLIDDVLSEGLTDQNFLTVDTSGGPANDFTLRRIRMADTIGKSYMLKHINDPAQSLFPVKPWPANWVVNVKIEMCAQGNIGAGYIDPSSAPNLLSVICEGSNAWLVMNAKDALYDAMLKGPKDALKVYGSRYLPQPFEILS